MKADLYINDRSFRHNGTDSQVEVEKKLFDLDSLLKHIKAFEDENEVKVNTNNLMEAKLTDKLSVWDYICADSSIVNRDVKNLLLTLLSKYRKCDASVKEMYEYLGPDYESEDECNGVIVLNRQGDIDESLQVMSNIQGWLEFRRYYLMKYPKTADFFVEEIKKYYPKLIFSQSVGTAGLNDVYTSHNKQICDVLSILNDVYPVEWRNYGHGGFWRFLEDFKHRHNLDGASRQNRHIWFKFGENNESVDCEPHIKIYKDDAGNKNQHCRIYFSQPTDDGMVYIGNIERHVKKEEGKLDK